MNYSENHTTKDFAIANQRGLGLVEVLVTLLVLSCSLMALAALQIRSIQFNQGSYFVSQANLTAYDMLDRMRLNNKALINYSGQTADATFNLASAPVTSPQSAVDLDQWRRSIASIFPNGSSLIACDNKNVCAITIIWTELHPSASLNSSGQLSEANTTSTSTSTFTYTAKL